MEMLRPRDVAGMLGVTPAGVYKMVKEGRLPFVRLGRSIRIPRAAWEIWLADMSTTAMAVVKESHHAEAV